MSCEHNSLYACPKCEMRNAYAARDLAIAERDNLRRLLKAALSTRYGKAYESVPVQEIWREIEAEVMR